jgi:hypothetical protein
VYTQKDNVSEIALWSAPGRDAKPRFPANRTYRNRVIAHRWENRSNYDRVLGDTTIEDSVIEGLIRKLPNPSFSPHSIKAKLAQMGAIPPFSVLLGKCVDDLPFLMVLTDPKPGSILITGINQSGKTSLLRLMLISASVLNSPTQVTTHLIVSRPAEYERVIHYPHCQTCVTPYGREASEIIINLSTIVNGRRSGRFLGSVIILVIDDLNALVRGGVDSEIMSHLSWLIKHGPQNQVWTFAALNTSQVDTMNPKILDIFGTRLLGNLNPARLLKSFSGIPYPPCDYSPFPFLFKALYGREWINFSVPVI